jgi:hypothetical protein
MKTSWFAVLSCMFAAPLCRAASDLDAFETQCGARQATGRDSRGELPTEAAILPRESGQRGARPYPTEADAFRVDVPDPPVDNQKGVADGVENGLAAGIESLTVITPQ